jgi:hypothetical protein
MKRNDILLAGFVVGIICAVINHFTLGILGAVVWSGLVTIPQLLSICSVRVAAGCLESMVLMGDFLFVILTPFLVLFVNYALNKKQYRWNSQKKLIVLSVLGIYLIIYILPRLLLPHGGF